MLNLARCQSVALVSLLLFDSPLTADAVELRFGEVEVLIGPSSPVPQTPAPGDLNTPFAMEFNAQGEMILVEYDGGRIFSWSAKKGLTKLAGDGKLGYVDGPADRARFNKLHNLAITNDGRCFLSDHENHAIRVYDPATKLVSSFAGNGTPGPAVPSTPVSEVRFRQPICIALSPNNESLLIADINNRVIRRLDFNEKVVTIVAGNTRTGVPKDGDLAIESALQDPRGAIENSDGQIFMIERGGNALRMIDSAGRLTTLAGGGKAGLADGPLGASKLNGPKHLCFGPGGIIFIADDNNHAIRWYDPETKQLQTVDFGSYRLNRPHGVCVYEGALYVADSYHHRVLRIKLADGR